MEINKNNPNLNALEYQKFLMAQSPNRNFNFNAMSGFTPPNLNRYLVYTPKDEKPQGNALLKTLLSIGGGALGAIGGTFVGGPVGTIAGGALGSGLGTAIGRAAGGQAVLGEGGAGEIALDTVLGGLFSGGVGKLVKGGAQVGKGALQMGAKEVAAQTAKGLGESAGVAAGKEAAQLATQKAISTAPKDIFGKLAVGGQRVAGSELGLKEGVKLGGKVVSPSELKAIQNFIRKDLGVTFAEASKPSAVLTKAEAYQTALRGELDNILAGSKKVFTNVDATDVLNIAKKNYLPGTNLANKGITRLETDAAKAITNGTPKTLNSFKNSLDKIINYSATNVTPEKQQVASALRQAIDAKLTTAVPESKQVLGKLSNVFKVNELVGAAGRKEAGKIGGVIDLAQRIATTVGARVGGAPATQAALTGLSAINTLGGRAVSPTLLSSLARQTTRGAVSPVAQQMISPQQQQTQDMQDMTGGMTDTTGMMSDMGGGTMGTGQDMGQQSQIDSYFQGLVLQDLKETGGKRLSAIKAAYDIFGGGKAAKPSAAQIKAEQQTMQVQSNIQQLGDLYQQAGGGRGRAGGLIGTAAGTVGLDQPAYNFNQFRDSMLAPLARAISGEVGVLTDRDIKRADGLLPKLTDSAQEAATKLRTLNNLLSSRASINQQVYSQGVGGSGQSLGDVLYNFPG